MPRFADSRIQVFASADLAVRVDRETEPEYPEAPPTFDVWFWKDPSVQTCPDGTRRYLTRGETLLSLTRDEAETLSRTLREALDYTDDSEAADVHCCDCGDCGCPECDTIPFPVVP